MLGKFHFHQMLPDQNEVFPKLTFSWSSLRAASTFRLASLLGAGAGARALLSALSSGVVSDAGNGALPSALQTGDVPPALLGGDRGAPYPQGLPALPG